MSKLKYLLQSKYFIIRSIMSSSFAIIMFSLITNFFAFHKQILNGDMKFYLNVNVLSISTKIISFIVFSLPSLFITNYLKKLEKIDITQDVNIFLFNKEKI